MLLKGAQQFCCGFIGNIFIGKIVQKQYCLKYNTLTSIYYVYTV